MSLSEMSTQYNIPKMHFFLLILSSQNYSLDIHITSSLEAAVIGHCYDEGLISSLYDLIISGSDESSKHKSRLWMEDVGEEISLQDWKGACMKAPKQAIKGNLKLNQYKWLMGTYITPVKLHQY